GLPGAQPSTPLQKMPSLHVASETQWKKVGRSVPRSGGVTPSSRVASRPRSVTTTSPCEAEQAVRMESVTKQSEARMPHRIATLRTRLRAGRRSVAAVGREHDEAHRVRRRGDLLARPEARSAPVVLPRLDAQPRAGRHVDREEDAVALRVAVVGA